jgi:hypothetical protein
MEPVYKHVVAANAPDCAYNIGNHYRFVARRMIMITNGIISNPPAMISTIANWRESPIPVNNPAPPPKNVYKPSARKSVPITSRIRIQIGTPDFGRSFNSKIS